MWTSVHPRSPEAAVYILALFIPLLHSIWAWKSRVCLLHAVWSRFLSCPTTSVLDWIASRFTESVNWCFVIYVHRLLAAFCAIHSLLFLCFCFTNFYITEWVHSKAAFSFHQRFPTFFLLSGFNLPPSVTSNLSSDLGSQTGLPLCGFVLGYLASLCTDLYQTHVYGSTHLERHWSLM